MKPELARRIAFTLGALLIYRLGTYIPLPGIKIPPQFPGGPIVNPLSIFSLWILPYVTAAILVQVASMVSSRLGALARSSDAGRRKIARYTISLAILLTVFQAYGTASSLQNAVPDLINEPRELFVLSATVSLTGGTVFLIWLSELITAYGVGNGLTWLFFTGVAAAMPAQIASCFELMRQGVLPAGHALLLAIFSVALIALIVFVELARRRIPIQFVARNLSGRVLPAQSSYLSLKLNSAGFLPTIVAPWFYFLPLSIVGTFFGQSPWLETAMGQLAFGHLGHMILGSVAIVVVAFLYTAFLVDPDHVAESLKKYGGVIPGIFPGEPTAEHVDRVVSRTTCVGAAYLVAVFLIPEILVAYYQSPFYLGGSSALIMVCTVLDLETQVRGGSLTEPGGVYS
jgi:preprotein translocase subunit SecY